ncbi:zinc finger protein 28-like [Zerene cesonia]|uniref:zinc finger protein 28-like n=1 Tax=Zerene cesonia TaxID=33412 RepID=UPI0018E57096|nr:zinc finger protein 28-like [Zerene cesonia]
MCEILNKTCKTCFSTGRTTSSITDLNILLTTLNIREIDTSNGEICWECKAVVFKFYDFKQKAIRLQNLLAASNQNKLKTFSSLTCKTKNIYDFEYNYEDEVKVESIKIELLSSEINFKDENTDFKTTYDISDNIDKTNHKKKNQIINKAKSIKERILNSKIIDKIENKDLKNGIEDKLIDEKELRNKFKTIIYTEEELLLNREEKRNHPNFKKIPFKCDTCVLGFIKKDSLDLHVEKYHRQTIGAYECKICEKRFATQHNLHKHTKNHYVSHRCLFCRYETVSQHAAIIHCRDKHFEDEAGRVRCSQCDSVFTSVEELEIHMSKHTISCQECGRYFKGKHTLRMHIRRIHNAHRQYICDSCQRTFNTKSRLESHMATHSVALAEKLSYCGICKVQYKNIYVYRNHLKNSVNHSERAYKCSHCNKIFASKLYLQKHIDFYHLLKSPYKCIICKKLFISEWRLVNHRQKHHGLARTRDHICNICGKRFYTSSTLRSHQLTHSEVRSFMCEDCGHTFKQRPALYTHYRLVHRGIKRK